MSGELPEPWGSALSGKGVHSYGDLAAGVDGMSESTAHRLVTGGPTSPGTVQAVADAYFGGDANKVWELRGSNLRSFGPWKAPDVVDLLTPKQRAAVEAVIVAMAPEEERQVMGNAEHPAPTTEDELTKRRAAGPTKKKAAARKTGRSPSLEE